ncbi:signal peptidase II [Demequina sp. NBRC 110055]|uniref:signal peptidase II n=1 Tax=Demequina sp. NBRC 110055 TaxID=1570344 RepID=UPI001186CFB7|nr:signal peptidase II [Demequina sp. NBRC 110055]
MTWRPAFWLVAAAVVAVDQATKIWSLNSLVPYEKHEIIGEWLQLQLVFNSGAAFSLGADYTWIVTLVMIAITVGIVWYARRAQSTLAIWLFGLGLGGAIGNLIDRVFREPGFMHGHVVDMINYNNWFVGNVADIAIVGVAVVFLIAAFAGRTVLAPLQGGDAGSAAAGSADGGSADAGDATPAGDADPSTTASASGTAADAPSPAAPSPATPDAGAHRG